MANFLNNNKQITQSYFDNKHLQDHCNKPRNTGVLDNPDFVLAYSNACGDSIDMYGYVSDTIIMDLKYMISGCMLSTASASLLTEYSIGKSVQQVTMLTVHEMSALLGVMLGPNRIACMMLSLDTLKTGMKKHA